MKKKQYNKPKRVKVAEQPVEKIEYPETPFVRGTGALPPEAPEAVKFNEVLIESGQTGATTKIYVDGKIIGNCIKVTYEATGNGMNKLTLVLLPKSVKIKGDAAIEEVPMTKGWHY